eukprot:1157650-Pelagomonas_calceolata.AAC.3
MDSHALLAHMPWRSHCINYSPTSVPQVSLKVTRVFYQILWTFMGLGLYTPMDSNTSEWKKWRIPGSGWLIG